MHSMEISTYVGELGLLLDTLPRQPIQDVADAVLTAYQYDRTIYIIGTSGSAAIATLVAANLVRRTTKQDTPPIRVLALTNNVALLSGLADEYGYAEIFSQQLSGLLRPGDVVVALSSSSFARHLVDALEFAGAAGAITVLLAGRSDDELMSLVDHSIIVPSDSEDMLELMHLIVCYAISSIVHRTAKERAPRFQAPGLSLSHSRLDESLS